MIGRSAVISLRASPYGRASCGLPGLKDGPSSPPLAVPSLALHRMGFAKPPGRPDAGGLLPRHFTLTSPERRESGVFSVALSLGLLPVPIKDHPALRCPDFPQDIRPATARLPPFLKPHSLRAYLQSCFPLSECISPRHDRGRASIAAPLPGMA